jgi:hypothetical protein
MAHQDYKVVVDVVGILEILPNLPFVVWKERNFNSNFERICAISSF